MSEWISVKDALPDSDYPTLLVSLSARVEKSHSGQVLVDTDAFYTDDGVFRFWGGVDEYEVTHWMPLPEPPSK